MLSKLLVPGRPTNMDCSREGPTALAVGACGGCLDIFTLVYHFFSFSLSLGDRLKYCLKRPLSPKQPTNQPIDVSKLKFKSGQEWTLPAQLGLLKTGQSRGKRLL